MNGRETYTADRAGERLDVFLARQPDGRSRAQIQRLIAAGQVLVDGGRVKSAARLEAGARVEVDAPPPAPVALAAESIPLSIVYEDADLLVLDKPSGMAVHPGPGQEHATVVNAVLAHAPDLSGVGGELRPGIVHRLDKDTSGLLIIAKHDRAHLNLSAQMAARTTEKEYLALVAGAPPAAGVIDAPVGRHPAQRKQMAVVEQGRPARTHFRALGPVGPNTLMLARLETGRTHQIRVHFAAAGHPVIGDRVYGTRSDLIGRQFLHAWRLAFAHPADGRRVALEAPLPEDCIDALRTGLARAADPAVNAAIAALLAEADRASTVQNPLVLTLESD